MSEVTIQPAPTAVPPAQQPADTAPRNDAQALVEALAENQQLKYDLAQAEAKLAAALAASSKPSKFSGLKKFGASILAALTTPEAIKVEKSLAVVALMRALILVPSLAAVIDIILAALGGPSVGVK